MGAIWLMVVVMVLMMLGQVQSLNFNFTSFSSDQPGLNRLTYQGDARRRLSDIRLTRVDGGSHQPFRHRVGRVVSSTRMRLWDRVYQRQAKFETQISFILSSARGPNPSDGLAFFIAPVNSTIPPGSSDGNMGIYDPSGRPMTTPLFAVEFDYFSDSWDPPNGRRHVGINVNSRSSIVWTGWDVSDGLRTNVTITYDPRERLVTVRSRTSTFSWQPRLEYRIDLKTLLPELVQVGISASTGNGAMNHDLLSWSFASVVVYDPHSTQYV